MQWIKFNQTPVNTKFDCNKPIVKNPTGHESGGTITGNSFCTDSIASDNSQITKEKSTEDSVAAGVKSNEMDTDQGSSDKGENVLTNIENVLHQSTETSSNTLRNFYQDGDINK